MSWSITINDLDQIEELPDELYDTACRDNQEYYGDANAAFNLAKEAGLVSATISGGRTPSPYGGPDSVVVSIVGFNNRNVGHAVPPMVGRDFNTTMVDTILTGPDEDSNYNDEDNDGYPGSGKWTPAVGGID